MSTRAVSGTWVFLVRLLGSWSESCALGLVGLRVLELARAPARLVLLLARLARLTQLVRVPEGAAHLLGLFSSWAFEGPCFESWSLGLAVLEPHAHAFVWYFFSLVWLVSLVVISLVVISLVVLCLQQSNVNMMHIKRASPKQRACTPARRALR